MIGHPAGFNAATHEEKSVTRGIGGIGQIASCPPSVAFDRSTGAVLATIAAALWDLLKPNRCVAIHRGFRYFGSEKCEPETLPDDFWVVVRSRR